MRKIHLAWLLVAGILASCTSSQSTTFDVDAALAQCDRQVHRTLAQLSADGAIDTTMIPRRVLPGDTAWMCRPVCAEEWCSGFWPGILWLDYEATPSPEVRQAAIDATLAMHRIVDRPVLDHDLGFLIFCSAGSGMRALERDLQRPDLPEAERVEDEALVDGFRTLCLRAADSLATLFRPTVGTILSWPRNVGMFGGHNTIIDNMINLELLSWAANEKGDEALWKIAKTHATTTNAHHFREDGSSYHVAVYDTLDGHFIHGVTHQGLADSSMWARGQSWAVYGFTMMAREAGKRGDADLRDLCLKRACSAADIFIKGLPGDFVPYWDFNDPRIATSPVTELTPSETVAPRDASAAAVVASALLELTNLVADKALSEHYFQTAENILRSLASDAYQAGTQNPAFLLHSTGNHPRNAEVDIPIIYADYYYIEALNRYKAFKE